MDRNLIDAWLERGILALALGILIFGPLATGAVRAADFIFIQGATCLLLVMWAARLGVARRLRLFWPPICWAVLAFVGYTVVRYFQADLEYVARQELIRVLVYAALFVVIVNNVLRKESVQLVVLSLVFLALGISLYAIYQWGSNSNMVWNFTRPDGYGRRGSGTYICPNHLAGFLELILPLGLAYTLAGKQSHLMKVLLGYASAVILAGIGVSFSRAGWAGAGLGLLLFFIIKMGNRHSRLPAIVMLAALLVGGLVFTQKSYVAQSRLAESFQLQGENSANIRHLIWASAFDMWQKNLWLGVGPGHFDYRFPEFRSEGVQRRPEYVHNDYLNTLVDWGVVGLGLVGVTLGMLVLGVVRCWKYVQRSGADLVSELGERSSPQSNRSAFVLGGCAGLFALAVHSAFDFNMQVPGNAILAVALMALLAGHFRFATDRYWFSLRRFRKLAAVAACLLVAGYLAGQGVRRALENHCLTSAGKVTTENLQTRIATLKSAWSIEPRNYETAYEIGETYRLQSWQGGDDYRDLAATAMEWFQEAIRLNPFDAYGYMRYGMCLHWLQRHDEAAPFFAKAETLDPNGYYMIAHQGWHQFQLENYPAAKILLERSLSLTPYPFPNPIASSYLQLIERRMKEPPSPFKSPGTVRK